MTISRRNLVIGMGAGAFVVRSAGAAELLRPTPQETFGPYFPVHTPRYHDFDLTRIPGRRSRALGQVIEVSGRVVRVDGSPVKGAALEIWQANAAVSIPSIVDSDSRPSWTVPRSRRRPPPILLRCPRYVDRTMIF
jgi:protocatechuate 3,4-dioxygenase beta subunit